jgi:hypothetical protein
MDPKSGARSSPAATSTASLGSSVPVRPAGRSERPIHLRVSGSLWPGRGSGLIDDHHVAIDACNMILPSRLANHPYVVPRWAAIAAETRLGVREPDRPAGRWSVWQWDARPARCRVDEASLSARSFTPQLLELGNATLECYKFHSTTEPGSIQ